MLRWVSLAIDVSKDLWNLGKVDDADRAVEILGLADFFTGLHPDDIAYIREFFGYSDNEHISQQDILLAAYPGDVSGDDANKVRGIVDTFFIGLNGSRQQTLLGENLDPGEDLDRGASVYIDDGAGIAPGMMVDDPHHQGPRPGTFFRCFVVDAAGRPQ